MVLVVGKFDDYDLGASVLDGLVVDHVCVDGIDVEEEGCVLGRDELEAYSETGFGIAGGLLRRCVSWFGEKKEVEVVGSTVVADGFVGRFLSHVPRANAARGCLSRGAYFSWEGDESHCVCCAVDIWWFLRGCAVLWISGGF